MALHCIADTALAARNATTAADVTAAAATAAAARRPGIPPPVRLMGEESLLVLSGPKHKHLRGLLAPSFSPEAVAAHPRYCTAGGAPLG